MTALQIRKPLVMLPYVVCEQGKVVSDGECYTIQVLINGIWLPLYHGLAKGTSWSNPEIPVSALLCRGNPCGLDIEIGEFPPQ